MNKRALIDGIGRKLREISARLKLARISRRTKLPAKTADLMKSYQAIVDQITLGDRSARSILIAGSARGEGRTITALGLAVAAAWTRPNKRVLLCDMDLRSPAISRLLGLKPSCGIKELLGQEASLDECIQSFSLGNLDVIPAGRTSVDLPDVLGKESLRPMLDALKERYVIIVVDSPPLGEFVDGALMAKSVDDVVMVVRTDHSHYAVIESAAEEFEKSGIAPLGYIFNDYVDPVPKFVAGRL